MCWGGSRRGRSLPRVWGSCSVGSCERGHDCPPRQVVARCLLVTVGLSADSVLLLLPCSWWRAPARCLCGSDRVRGRIIAAALVRRNPRPLVHACRGGAH